MDKDKFVLYAGIILLFVLAMLVITIHFFDYTDLSSGGYWFNVEVNAFMYDFVLYLSLSLIIIFIILWIKRRG